MSSARISKAPLFIAGAAVLVAGLVITLFVAPLACGRKAESSDRVAREAAALSASAKSSESESATRSATPSANASADTTAVLLVAAQPLDIPLIPCASAILIEPSTNTVLYEQNARALRAPASIVKMTLEMAVLDEVAAGRLALTDSIRVSAWASNIGGSQAYLAEGEVFPLEDLLKAIVVSSANDACVAVAEHIAGSADGFVTLMNQEVERLGLTDTRYVNVHGLDDNPATGNVTTAYDIAQIGRELIRHPHVLEWSSIEKEPFRDGAFILENTNKLVGRFEGLDGLKTGYTAKAGFCLCATAERRDLRLISVVLGCESNRDRFADTAELLSAGFNSYSRVDVARRGADIKEEVSVEGGKPELIRPVAPRDVAALVSRIDERRLERRFVPRAGLRAPLHAGEEVGNIELFVGDRVLASYVVVSPIDVRKTGLMAWVSGLFSRD